MRLRLIIIFLLLSFVSVNSQIISFSKDSLNIQWNNETYMASDTTWIFNLGENDLIIDSILTKKMYGYRIYSSSFPDSYSYVVGYDKPPINLRVTPGDSVEIILADPDLCPFCKKSSVQVFFIDTLNFVSNSITGRYYTIDVRGDGPSSVDERTDIPSEVKLFQNYPNPFNPNTTIKFYLSQGSIVNIIIYDLLGNIIQELVDNKYLIGQHEIEFDGSNLCSGIYFYRLITNKSIQTKKFLLLK